MNHIKTGYKRVIYSFIIIFGLLLLSIFLSGCDSETNLQQQALEHKTNSIYFNGGQISIMCQQMREHPEWFKKGSIKEFKTICEQYKDFEAFDKNLKADRFIKIAEREK